MKLADVKSQLGIPTFELRYSQDETGKRAIDKETNQPTKWLRHWDNDNRVAVSIHEDVVNSIKGGKDSDLGIQTETRQGNKGEYTAHRIVLYTQEPSDMVL